MKGRDAEEPDDFGFGESSRYAAHLDRGWAMLDRGDPAAARTSAEHAQQTRPDDPDAALLLGAVSLAEADPEQSLRYYDRAIELDPDYLEPYTAAAQVCLFDLDDPARGLRYCTDALELDTLGPFERLDLQLVAAECELSEGSERPAEERLGSLSEEAVLMATLRLGADPEARAAVDPNDSDSEDAVAWSYLCLDPDGDELDDDERLDRIGRALAYAYRLARMRLDLDQAQTVRETLGTVLDWYPAESDAWYLSSEAHHRLGQLPEACVCAVKTLELDHEVELPAWIPEFTAVHRRTVDLIAGSSEPAFAALLGTGRPVTVLVREAPAPELVMEGVDPRAPVLALAGRPVGIAPPQPNDAPPKPQLTGLAVYRRNIARFVPDADRFDHELHHAVLEELAAFVGLDNGARKRIGLAPLPPYDVPSPEEWAAAIAAEAGTDGDGDSKPRKRGRRRRSPA